MTTLTDEQIEDIAERAAKKAVAEALQAMYVEIGRNVLKKTFYIVGIGVIALGMWLASHGYK